MIYELHLGTYTGAGTIESAIEKLHYLLDDDPTVLPDPRSARQHDGVHARSQ